MVSGLVKDFDGTTLVDKYLFNRVVLKFNGDDHGVILLVIDAMEIIVGEGDGGHSAFVVTMGYIVDGLDVTKVFFPS